MTAKSFTQHEQYLARIANTPLGSFNKLPTMYLRNQEITGFIASSVFSMRYEKA